MPAQVTLVTQPAGSKLCGHCIVAMILGTSLEEAVKLIGHEHGTTLQELASACAPMVRIDRFLTRSNTVQKLPEYAVLRYRYGRPTEKNSHWVLLWNCEWIYDPSIDEPYRLGFDYYDMTHDDSVRITSFAQIHYGEGWVC